MHHTIPERILAALEELSEQAAAWWAEEQDWESIAHEQAVLERMRAALPRLLRALLEATISGLHPRLARRLQACPGPRGLH